MGRVKKSKMNTAVRNKRNILKRYEVKPIELVCAEMDSGDESEVILPETDISRPSTSESGSNKPTNVFEKPTGFALYDSYKIKLDANENAPKYVLVDQNKLTSFLQSFKCPQCVGNLQVSQLSAKGYANFFNVKCSDCDYADTLNTSTTTDKCDANSTRQPFDVNRRMVQGFLSIGKGHRGMEAFSMIMNMKHMNSLSYNKHIKLIHAKYNTVARESLEKARQEVKKAYSVIHHISLDEPGPINIAVSFDGSWQKRGFTSKNGVGCCIDVVTGLVIDYEVLSKYCRLCEQKKKELGKDSISFRDWYARHKPNCQQNYTGSSPAMETEAAARIWMRSENNGFRYTTIVSDGDSKTFSHLTSMDIYKDHAIEKVECLNHVAKRLGTGLRNIVKDNTGKGEPLGGKSHGSLKATTIDKLTSYYRNAIQGNLGDIKKMKAAIFATLSHCSSTDEKPMHGKCPKGSASWCFYNRAIAKGETPEAHKIKIRTPLTERVVSKILPLYQRLSSDALLQRCVSGKTQNANEALHGVIWTKCPKTSFSSRTRLEIGASEAICQYNTGYNQSMLDLQRSVGISPGRSTSRIAKSFDQKRLKLAQTRKKMKFTDYRRKLRQAQLEEEQRKIEEEGKTYGAGEF